MMFFDVISSGSKGNATLVFIDESIFLIDCGIPAKQVESELAIFGKSSKDVTAMLITHDHADHYRGLKFISPKKQYATIGTLPGGLSNVIDVDVPFEINGVKITAFMTSHDASNPCGYVLEKGEQKLVYMTDTGMYLTRNTPLLKNPTYLIIESNHDIKMLMHTNRPMEVKQRIMSPLGHLCNEDSAFATLQIIGDKTKEIVLAHLSEEANTPELALEAYDKVFRHAHVDINRYEVKCAKQWEHLLGGEYED